jgi:hypothetical protein
MYRKLYYIVFGNCIFDNTEIHDHSTFSVFISGVRDFILTNYGNNKVSIVQELGKSKVNDMEVDDCIIENSIFYNMFFDDNTIELVFTESVKSNRKYTGEYGYKLALAPAIIYQPKDDTQLKIKHMRVLPLVPVLLKLRIPKDATTVIPTFQSNNYTTKMRSDKVIVDSMYMILRNESKKQKLIKIEVNDSVYMKGQPTYDNHVYVSPDYDFKISNSEFISPYYNSFYRNNIKNDNLYKINQEFSVDCCADLPVECDKGIHFFATENEALIFYNHYLKMSNNTLGTFISRAEIKIKKDKKSINLYNFKYIYCIVNDMFII